MMTIDVQSTVGDLVTERPSRSRVFEKYGIDFCCGGKLPLAEACRNSGVDASEVLEALAAEDSPGAGDQQDWSQASMTALADHIEQTHHAYLRQELPRLTAMTQKVNAAHGERHTELAEVERTFAGLRDELTEHMMKEEQVLFPMIRRLESADGPVQFHCGSVNNPIRMMEHEHDSASHALTRLRELTKDYAPPEDACNTYRAMLDGLRELELDLHQHIHKENNVLFPRAARRESELMN